jgi:hypothetical protein
VAELRGWDSTREKLEAQWPVLTRDELEATRGQTDLVDAVLRAKLGYAHRLVEECLAQTPRRK